MGAGRMRSICCLLLIGSVLYVFGAGPWVYFRCRQAGEFDGEYGPFQPVLSIMNAMPGEIESLHTAYVCKCIVWGLDNDSSKAQQ